MMFYSHISFFRTLLETLDAELLWLFEDSQRLEKRIQRAVFSEPDKLFWITLAIACTEPIAHSRISFAKSLPAGNQVRFHAFKNNCRIVALFH